MGKETRDRILNNNRCLDILSKDKSDITEEERLFLKKEYTGWGSIMGNTIGLAQFFTPDHVCKFLAEYLNPLLPHNPKVLEPAAGVGALLNYIRDDAEITCVELEPSQCKILEYTEPSYKVLNISAGEFDRPNYYDLVIGNPPFNLTIETEKEWTLRKKTGKINSDELFLELAIESCKEGGYIAFILPQSINYKTQLKGIRELIWNTCWVIANISLPAETFAASGTNIPVTILILRKAPSTLPKVNSTNPEIEKEFLLGQPGIIQAEINNIGYDKKGNITAKRDSDGLFTQLDELLINMTEDDNFYFRNTCPHMNTKHDDTYLSIDKGNYGYELQWWKPKRDCHKEWVVETLGRGMEIEFEGIEYETYNWNVMDELIDKYGTRE